MTASVQETMVMLPAWDQLMGAEDGDGDEYGDDYEEGEEEEEGDEEEEDSYTNAARSLFGF